MCRCAGPVPFEGPARLLSEQSRAGWCGASAGRRCLGSEVYYGMPQRLLDILRACREGRLSAAAQEALDFIERADIPQFTWSNETERSTWIAEIWEIRRSSPKFKRDAFVGLDESIDSLGANEVAVRHALVETGKGLV